MKVYEAVQTISSGPPRTPPHSSRVASDIYQGRALTPCNTSLTTGVQNVAMMTTTSSHNETYAMLKNELQGRVSYNEHGILAKINSQSPANTNFASEVYNKMCQDEKFQIHWKELREIVKAADEGAGNGETQMYPHLVRGWSLHIILSNKLYRNMYSITSLIPTI